MTILTGGSVDDWRGFVPAHHVAVDARLEHWRANDHPRSSRIDQKANVVDRWTNATGSLP